MWDDVRQYAARELIKALPTHAAHGARFRAKCFMVGDLFFHYTRKYLQDHGDRRVQCGRWTTYDLETGGGTLLRAMLALSQLPKRVGGGSVIQLHHVTQLAYNRDMQEFRVTGTLRVNKVQ